MKVILFILFLLIIYLAYREGTLPMWLAGLLVLAVITGNTFLGKIGLFMFNNGLY